MDDLEHTPGWRAASRALWLIGTAVVAAHGVAMLIYGPGIRAEAEEAERQQIMAEHAVVCDKLQKVEGGPGREHCLNLLLQLQQRHKQAYVVQTSSPF